MTSVHVRVSAVLTSWPFLTSLGVLLMNDLALKRAYPGAVSGKLSDISGIAVVALLLFAIFPRGRVWISAGLATAFLWWKSSASSEFIEWVNSLGVLTVGRTVDYTDLGALAVLPICHVIAAAIDRYAMPWQRVRRLLRVPIAAATLLALLGTSVPVAYQTYRVRDTSSAQQLQRDAVAAAIKTVAEKHGLACRDCARHAESATYEGRGVTMTYTFDGVDVVAFSIRAFPSGLFWGASGADKADAIRASLKSELATRFRGLEYIEPLDPLAR